MKKNFYYKSFYLVVTSLWIYGCGPSKQASETIPVEESKEITVTVDASDFTSRSDSWSENTDPITSGNWVSFEANFTTAGRYKTAIYGATDSFAGVWVEDYVDNKDGRTYDVSGTMRMDSAKAFVSVDGSPFNVGTHQMKFHVRDGSVNLDRIEFTLMFEHQLTPNNLTQNMDGKEWELVWSDEFDGEVLDSSKWIYDVGDWGWGNNELQYYTSNRSENVRIEDGNLVIEAIKDDKGAWTSGRVTTRGKQSFTYGKIEMRAIVPGGKGNWTAGWTLGDSYRDEISWPYCGEIDIVESVGYEVDPETGDGIAHATVHTPAYYFKANNQINSKKEVKNITGEFHNYAVVWTETEIRAYLDDEEYYIYDKNSNDLEWPFKDPQNIILNLAMGGGWGGAQGMDPSVNNQKYILDYVRVYGKK